MVKQCSAIISESGTIEEARALFEEYAGSIGFSLSFQGFERELAELPGRYAPPSGRLLFSREAGELAGCIAMRQLDARTCEMKRLFVRPAFHGKGIGRKLVVAIIQAARSAGYEAMRLDTVPTMTPAIALYESLGFVAIEPYTNNPMPGTRFLELRL